MVKGLAHCISLHTKIWLDCNHFWATVHTTVPAHLEAAAISLSPEFGHYGLVLSEVWLLI